MSSILDILKKIQKLAENGVDGEKINAKNILDKLMKEHNISAEELQNDKVEFCFFKIPDYKNSFELRLLRQLTGIYKLNLYGKFPDKMIKEDRLKGNFAIECSKSVYLEILAKYEFYIERYKIREDEFFYAFCFKNDLLVDREDNDDSKISETEKETLINALNIAKSINSDTFHKQLRN